jgi:hypothetical protein
VPSEEPRSAIPHETFSHAVLIKLPQTGTAGQEKFSQPGQSPGNDEIRMTNPIRISNEGNNETKQKRAPGERFVIRALVIPH